MRRSPQAHKPYESVLKDWWEEGAEERRRTAQQQRVKAIRGAVRVIAFTFTAAAAAVLVAAFIDNLGRNGDPHGREISWWLVMYGVCCGAATYALFSDWQRRGRAAMDEEHASAAVLVVPLLGGYLLLVALALDALGRAILLRSGLL